MAETEISDDRPISEVLGKLSRLMGAVFSEIVNSSLVELGEPPCDFACLAFGSMARSEMCLRSDIEWGIVTASNEEACLGYFRNLSTLVELKVGALGETGWHFVPERSLPKGFRVDKAVGAIHGSISVLGTPGTLAGHQVTSSQESAEINAMLYSSLIAGEPKLHQEYKKRLRALFDARAGKRRRERVRMLVSWNDQEFKADLRKRSQGKSEWVDIKGELLRPLQMGIESLAILHGIESPRTVERLSELAKAGVVAAEATADLRYAFEQALRLRLEAHLFYRDETDYVFTVPQGGREFVATSEQRRSIGEIFQTVRAFMPALDKMVKHPDMKEVRFNDSFKGAPISKEATEAFDSGRHEEGLEWLKAAIFADPNDEGAKRLLDTLIRDKKLDPNHVPVLEQAVREGDAGACYKLSRHYFDGVGVQGGKDEGEGTRLARLAITRGNAEGYVALGKHEQSKGQQAEAMDNYKEGAEQGSIRCSVLAAQLYWGRGEFANALRFLLRGRNDDQEDLYTTIGLIYSWGKGVEKDPKQAFTYFWKGMNHRDPDPRATELVGRCYGYGFGTELNLQRAGKLLNSVSDLSPESRYILGRCLLYGLGVPKEPKRAVSLLMAARKAGRSEASLYLGFSLLHGWGVNADRQAAARFFREAAERGEGEGAYQLALLLEAGSVSPKRPKEVVERLQMAADQGLSKAYYYLSLHYLSGKLVGRDEKQAVDLLNKGVKAGDAQAERQLGLCYLNGTAVRKSPSTSMWYFRRAAKQGDGESLYQCGVYFYQESVDQALQYWRTAAKSGHQLAGYRMGLHYSESRPHIAQRWLEEPARQGHGPSQKELGKLLHDSYPGRAVELYKEAAAQGDLEANHRLGFCFYNGHGIEKNDHEAIRYYAKAGDSPAARAALAECYYLGRGVAVNLDEAARLYRQAAQKLDPKGIFGLARCYEKGHGIPSNLGMAIQLYEMLADSDPEAMYRLAEIYKQSNDLRTTELYKRAAQMGHAEACLAYASSLVPTTNSYTRATILKLLNKASKAGLVEAQLWLGELLTADGTSLREQRFGLSWWRAARAQGNPDATYYLGCCLLYGRGTQKQPDLAVSVLVEACDLGSRNAMFQFYLMYDAGEGVPQSSEYAQQWYLAAQKAGYSSETDTIVGRWRQSARLEKLKARRRVRIARSVRFPKGPLVAHRRAIEDTTPDGDYLRARQWYRAGRHGIAAVHYAKAVRLGDRYAALKLAGLYRIGQGVEKSLTRAADLYEQAWDVFGGAGWYGLSHVWREWGDEDQADDYYQMIFDSGDWDLLVDFIRYCKHQV